MQKFLPFFFHRETFAFEANPREDSVKKQHKPAQPSLCRDSSSQNPAFYWDEIQQNTNAVIKK